MKNKTKKKRTLKIMDIFIISVSLTELLVTLAVFGLYYTFSAINWNFETIFLSSTSVTILVITIITIFAASKIGKNIFKPFMKIRDAAKNVINGDFSVRLPENSRIVEIDEVATDFNIMVKELGNTEILREEFIANVSHEFKTPLSVIEGYVTLLQGEISPEEKEEYINMILQNTEKLSTLTGNILAISKLENRSIPLEKESFRIDKQICNVMVDYDEIWEEKNMDIDMNLEPIEYYGFRMLLTRVWSNLIQNAIKFSNQNGKLKITCKEVENNVMIIVSDKGIGMNDEVKKHIFDKFYQGESSRSTQGNGLGLALVKQIIELSNGTISVESEIGKGSEFIIQLPISK